jgi:hypothetical protein
VQCIGASDRVSGVIMTSMKNPNFTFGRKEKGAAIQFQYKFSEFL